MTAVPKDNCNTAQLSPVALVIYSPVCGDYWRSLPVRRTGGLFANRGDRGSDVFLEENEINSLETVQFDRQLSGVQIHLKKTAGIDFIDRAVSLFRLTRVF